MQTVFKSMKDYRQSIVSAESNRLISAACIAAVFGWFIGLGSGLLFLTIVQAIGLSLLSTIAGFVIGYVLYLRSVLVAARDNLKNVTILQEEDRAE